MPQVSQKSKRSTRLKKISRAVSNATPLAAADSTSSEVLQETKESSAAELERSAPLVRVRCRNCRSIYYFKTHEPMRSTCMECGETILVKPSGRKWWLIWGGIVLLLVLSGVAVALAIY